jgi:hypothetical protein
MGGFGDEGDSGESEDEEDEGPDAREVGGEPLGPADEAAALAPGPAPFLHYRSGFMNRQKKRLALNGLTGVLKGIQSEVLKADPNVNRYAPHVYLTLEFASRTFDLEVSDGEVSTRDRLLHGFRYIVICNELARKRGGRVDSWDLGEDHAKERMRRAWDGRTSEVDDALRGRVQKWAEGRRTMTRVNRQESAASVETLPDENEYFVGAGASRSSSAAHSDVLHDDDLDRSRSSSVSSIGDGDSLEDSLGSEEADAAVLEFGRVPERAGGGGGGAGGEGGEEKKTGGEEVRKEFGAPVVVGGRGVVSPRPGFEVPEETRRSVSAEEDEINLDVGLEIS